MAEDNPTNRIVIHRILSQRGYAHEIVDDGAQALECIKSNSYGLLFTDCRMPVMDGFTLTREIRKLGTEASRTLPIIALTADALAETREDCQNAGMDGFLTKPIVTKDLVKVLDLHLPQARELRQPSQTDSPRPSSASTLEIDPAILDLSGIEEIFGGVTPDAIAFLRNFGAGLNRQIESISTALAAQDLVAAQNAAHTLKGSARSAGGIRLGNLADDIQTALEDHDPDTAAFLTEMLAETTTELQNAISLLNPVR